MSTIITTKYITLDEYERMVDEDVFSDCPPMELLDGELVVKMTKKPPHTTSDELCGDELGRVIPAGWHVRAGQPVRLPPQNSEPEPDRSVVRGARRDYAKRHPGPSDVALVVEVSDTTLAQDRGRRLKIYATAMIPFTWIVNLIAGQIQVYSEPGPSDYGSRTDYKAGEAIPVVIDGHRVGVIAVDDVLPDRE